MLLGLAIIDIDKRRLGMASAATYKGDDGSQCVVVIGDGAMTAGLAFEGMTMPVWRIRIVLIVLQ